MNNLKSISFLFFSTTLICSVNGITVIRNKNKTDHDLLAKTDFRYYLDSLEKLVDFYTRHRFYVDLSSAFGLFMVDVNLSSHLEQQQHDFPVKIRSRLEVLLVRIGVLSEYFHFMVQQMKSKRKEKRENVRDIRLSEIFYNKTTWAGAPDKFNKGLMMHRKIFSPEQLKIRYGDWDDYVNEVNKSPGLDDCLSLLARNLPSKSPEKCRLPTRCQKRVGEGTDVGLSVSHWVFVLITARFSRQCFVFSESVDKYELDEYCAKYFHEVQYIAANDFKLPTVLSHHCALCGLIGHAQFYRRFWHKKLTQFQTAEGCFSDSLRVEKFEDSQTKEDFARADELDDNLREGPSYEWDIAPKSTFLDGKCDSHFTSVSLVTLSNALRFIIETYY